ncbi:VOC family protein [Flavobacterium ardleyense]|uniref:VOC family protein n=1 Tax=Flavobacterium ardleyense TaxID=2038737 RepID=A0ABW5Z4L6_9FLAO
MTFRFARHTNNLEQLKNFYCSLIGFEILGNFENHNGYDGVFIGKKNENWHLEFTKSDEVIAFNFGEEDLLVFYPNTKKEYYQILENFKTNSVPAIKSKNPYWMENGKMYSDPDGNHIIISDLKTA